MKLKKSLCFFALFLLTVCFTACEDDDTPLPAYITELAELQTDADGRAFRLIQDQGSILNIANTQDINRLVADTIYRVQVLYVKEDDNTVTVSGLSGVTSPLPISIKEEEMKRDPLQLDAIWRSGRYVNFITSLSTAGNSHIFAFADNGISIQNDGSLLLRIELYHDRNNDPEHFTRQAVLSCPLFEYEEALTEGRDSVEITVNTYKGVSVTRWPM